MTYFALDRLPGAHVLIDYVPRTLLVERLDEIADGEFRLVRWPDDSDAPKRQILEQEKIKDVFAAC